MSGRTRIQSLQQTVAHGRSQTIRCPFRPRQSRRQENTGALEYVSVPKQHQE